MDIDIRWIKLVLRFKLRSLYEVDMAHNRAGVLATSEITSKEIYYYEGRLGKCEAHSFMSPILHNVKTECNCSTFSS